MTTNSPVDLSNASDEQLKQIHSDVLKKLSARAVVPSSVMDGYDRHGSGHSRSGGGSSLIDKVSTPAIKNVHS